MPRVAVLALVVSLALLASISDALRSGGTEAARGSAASTGALGAAPRYRFIYNSSSDPRGAADSGWNLIDVGSKWAVVPAGTKGLIWVGDYDNSACAWDISDSSLTDQIKAIARDPKVAGYFFSDEPDPDVCPKAPTQHRARSKLIHSLDPGKLAVMVMDANSGQASLRQIPLWVGTADYVGLDPYPCYQGKPCDYPWIDTIIKGANRARLSYWGVVQAFSDSTWRWPTPAEERHMLSQWAASKQSGYMTFAWTWAGNKLSSQSALLEVLRQFNHGDIASPKGARATEVHFSFTGPTSVAFDWRGTARTIRYGLTSTYTRTVAARTPNPVPFSSVGPFWEARITGLRRGTKYHYSIGGGPDRTFSTAPTGPFRFDVEADVGDSANYVDARRTQEQIAADRPALVLVSGDLTYGDVNGQSAVSRHFKDVMVWSQKAAYMPAWGNHEWGERADDLRNYKGRFAIPHGHGSPGAPREGCCGEDWGWFESGGVRFISYPEPYSDSTWPNWQSKADRLMAAGQANRSINFIVTFGHRPAYSTGYHSGDSELASILNAFGDRYSKYVANFNGHSHDYERFRPIHNVVHITAAGGGAPLETPWSSTDSRTAYRAMHLEHIRVDVTAARLRIEAVCGPSTSDDDITCRPGEVIDSYTIRRPNR